MERWLVEALTAGAERVAAWADLLDEINVFPVADGDTGRNLKISLAPLGQADEAAEACCRRLVAAATGNSGNIAAAFLTGFLPRVDGRRVDGAVSAGREAAWKAVANPLPGTMLTLFDALHAGTRAWPERPGSKDADDLVDALEGAVRSTPDLLPSLKPAGVVDAGALGMFIFFEGFLHRLTDGGTALTPVTRRFEGLLRVTGGTADDGRRGFCVNALLAPSVPGAQGVDADLGDCVVAVPDGERLRLHLHTADPDGTRARLEALGELTDWLAEPLTADGASLLTSTDGRSIQVMTDAAGSLTRSEARRLGILLLDSYLILDGARVPETLADPHRVYEAMAAGRPVSTAQASAFQRRQSYESALERHRRVVYLCVGSAYTGNVDAARRWQAESGSADRFTVMDTGAASGRLGLIARLVAGYAGSGAAPEAVLRFAGRAVAHCGELLFLDQLKYLAAGGRISRSRGFVGDLLGIKPVISPRADGAVKVGTVRRASEQVTFALEHLGRQFSHRDRPTLLLQFSDNEQRVREAIGPALQTHFPRAAILTTPLSLTSGAHMGPGTWGVAFCPDLTKDGWRP